MHNLRRVASHSSEVSGLLNPFNFYLNSAKIGSPILLSVFGNSRESRYFSIFVNFFFSISYFIPSNLSISRWRESLCCTISAQAAICWETLSNSFYGVEQLIEVVSKRAMSYKSIDSKDVPKSKDRANFHNLIPLPNTSTQNTNAVVRIFIKNYIKTDLITTIQYFNPFRNYFAKKSADLHYCACNS